MKSGSISSACDRLLHPRVAAEGGRGRQGRFLGLMLASPFLAAAAAAPVLMSTLGAAPALAATGMILCAGWLVALLVATTGHSRIAEVLALIGVSAGIAALIASAGGFASPLTVLFAVLPVEARWIGRSRKAGLAGLAAAGVSVLGSAVLGSTILGHASQEVSLWQWAVPLVYAATLWPRLGQLGAGEASPVVDAVPSRLEDIVQAMTLRMTMNGDVTAASAQTERMLGVACDMVLGTSFFERIHLADRVAYLSALADLRRGAANRTVELRLRQAAADPGETFGYLPVLGEMMHDGSGGLIAMLSEDTRACDLKAALARETERRREAEIGRARMMGAVSHELRTPLNAILGFSDVLSKEMFGSLRNARQAEYVGLIHDAGEHLLSVVNALLDLSRIESGAVASDAETFRFEDAVSLSLSMISAQAEEAGVQVEREGEPVGDIHCDRRILQQVLINLLCNAVKFTPPGGSVTLTAGKRDGWLDFEVSDTGVGMTREDLDRVGTPFVRVGGRNAAARDGAGLGLSLVKGLVELQRGGMSIESAPAAGTRVRVSIPVAGEAAKEADKARDGQEDEQEDGKTDVLRKAG